MESFKEGLSVAGVKTVERVIFVVVVIIIIIIIIIIIMNGEFEKMCKIIAVAYMTPPFWHLLRETEKYDECLMANDLRAEI
jgi:hypothetical protein